MAVVGSAGDGTAAAAVGTGSRLHDVLAANAREIRTRMYEVFFKVTTQTSPKVSTKSK